MKRLILILLCLMVPFLTGARRWIPRQAAAGPNAWFDTGTINGDNAGKNNDSSNNYKPNGGIALTAGLATKARVRIRTYYGGGAVNVRVSLCDSGGTSVASGNASTSTSNSTLEITFTSSVAVTTATYHLVITAANTNIDYGYNNAAGTIDYSNVYGYTGSPGNVSAVSSTDTPATLLCGVFVQ
jgi:hypothetical protein